MLQGIEIVLETEADRGQVVQDCVGQSEEFGFFSGKPIKGVKMRREMIPPAAGGRMDSVEQE